jgi:hypothetical protein
VLQDAEHRDLARHHRPDGERHGPGAGERSDAVGEHGEADGDGLGASGADVAGGQVGVRDEHAAVVDLGAATGLGLRTARSAWRVALREGGISASGPPGKRRARSGGAYPACLPWQRPAFGSGRGRVSCGGTGDKG